jgi:hypothetical protein
VQTTRLSTSLVTTGFPFRSVDWDGCPGRLHSLVVVVANVVVVVLVVARVVVVGVKPGGGTGPVPRPGPSDGSVVC